MNEPLQLTPTEAATMLSIGRSKLYELLAAGELPVVYIGRSCRIPLDDLRVWVKTRTKNPLPECEPALDRAA